MIDEPAYTISHVVTFTRRSKTSIRSYLRDGKIESTTIDIAGTNLWSLAELCRTYLRIYCLPPTSEYVASFLFDQGIREEVIVRSLLTKLHIRELVLPWNS